MVEFETRRWCARGLEHALHSISSLPETLPETNALQSLPPFSRPPKEKSLESEIVWERLLRLEFVVDDEGGGFFRFRFFVFFRLVWLESLPCVVGGGGEGFGNASIDEKRSSHSDMMKHNGVSLRLNEMCVYVLAATGKGERRLLSPTKLSRYA